VVDGPYFEDLQVGQRFPAAPVTLTEGLAAAHQAVVGSRLPLAGAHRLSRQVLGDGVLAAPNLVWDVAIGQSTVVTHAVVANLFYRGVVFHRAPRLGDSLRTVTRSSASGRTRGGRGAARPGSSRCGSAPTTSTAAGAGLLAVRDAAAAGRVDGHRAGRRPELGRPRAVGGRAGVRSPPAGTSTPTGPPARGRTSTASGPATCTWSPAATWSAPARSWPG
jgi:acyl dehydratase